MILDKFELVFLTFFLIANLFIFFNFDFLKKNIRIFDNPDHILKRHKKKTSLLGGTILLFNFFLFFFLNFFLEKNLIDLGNKEIAFFLLLVVSYFLIGLYDDKYKINPNLKLSLIFIATILITLIYPDFSLRMIKISFLEKNYFFNYFSIPFTVLSFALLVNALNMFDGIDLQLITYSIFIFIVLIFKDVFLIFSIMMLICLIFIYILNFKKKLFLGDNGAFLLSGIIGFIFVNKYNNDPLFFSSDEIFLILMVPGIDMLRLFTVRIINKKNPFKGDLNHMHHLLKKKYENIIKTNFVLSLFYVIPFLCLIAGFKTYLILCFYCILYISFLKILLKTSK